MVEMRENAQKFVALDAGNDSVKVARREPGGHGEVCYSFPNLIAPVTNNVLRDFPGFQSSNPSIVTTGDGEWAIGESAEEISTYTKSHVGYRKYGDPEFDILVSAALGTAYPNAGGPTALIFSLPVEGFGQAGNQVARLRGVRSFNFCGVNLTFDLDPVIAIPETFGSMCAELLSPSGTIVNRDLVFDSKDRPQNVVVVDAGGGTTQTVTFRGLKLGPVHEAIERGGLHILDYINKELKRSFQRKDVDRSTLMDVLKYGDFNHAGTSYDVRDLVQTAVSNYASEVFNFWKNPNGIAGGGDYHAAIFTGGWMPWIWPYLTVSMEEQGIGHDNIIRPPDHLSYSYNAIGILRYLRFLANQGHA